MFFEFIHASPAQSLNRFSLQQFVDKVCGFYGPAIRDISLGDDDLLFLQFLFYLLSRFTQIGPFTHHYLIDDDSKSVIINFITMILVKHYFRCHVAWCARSILIIALPQMFSYSQVCEICVTQINEKLPSLSKTIFSGFTSL